MNSLTLIPAVKHIEISNVPCTLDKFEIDTLSISHAKKLILDGKITCILDAKLPPESYGLSIKPNNVVITHGDNSGILYALATLKQIFDQWDAPYALEIYDEPDFPLRGYMLDISRGKVPTLSTVKKIVDNLVLLKINHLELYIEGFSFAYPSFQKFWQDKTPMTPEEIRELDAYCDDRGIDLTPNQNCFGHMGPWLETDEYKHLGFGLVKQTVNPLNGESIELVEKMCDDLLPNFTSENFNVCLDEPFGLDSLSKKGREAKDMYLEHTLKVHEICVKHGKKMMMWGDIVMRHPELVGKLPDDITVLEWGYTADHPFDEHCAKYQKAGKAFIVCPGSSTWSSFTQKTDVALTNIKNAVEAGKKYGASGVLLTDWGDMGHVQYLPCTYIPLSYAAMRAWNAEDNDVERLLSFVNKYFFLDESDSLAQILYVLGQYTKFEVENDVDNNSKTFMTYSAGLWHKPCFDPICNVLGNLLDKSIIRYYPDRILRHTAMCHEALSDIAPTNDETKLVIDEINNAIIQISVGAILRDYIENEKEMTKEQRIKTLENVFSLIEESKIAHGKCWMARNKAFDCYGFYDKTAARTIKGVDKQLRRLKKNYPLYCLGLYVGSPILGAILRPVGKLAKRTVKKFLGLN